MLLVGLTGGIGSGKSTVAELLARRGAHVLDADRVARQVVEPGGPAYQAMIDRFGEDIVLADGTLDRTVIAARAFASPGAVADLNAITHPAIAEVMAARVAEHAGTDDVVIMDIPLLAESTRRTYRLAGVIVVDTPVDTAVERLIVQRGLAEADARARMASQVSRQERIQLADAVVDNSGDRAALEREVDRVWRWIEGLRGSAGTG